MAKAKQVEVEVTELHTRKLNCLVVGETPLIMNRFSEKARQEMLMPAPKKNRAEKATSLKHDPIAEFRSGMYMSRSDNYPTAVHLPTNCFHKAIGQAAVDMPGATRAAIMRLTGITSHTVHFYGLPSMFCRMVRSSGMNSVPDMRTRPIFREWACALEIQIVSNLVKESQVLNLLAAAGTIVGIGDWRPQKGGSFGRFRLVTADDADWLRITQHQGREAQIGAIETPVSFDDETDELMSWFFDAAAERELRPTLPGSYAIAAE